MKKLTAAIAVIIIMLTLISCGNKQMLDTTYTFTWAVLELPGGKLIEGEVETWRDFTDGDQIQVKIDGVTYLVHSSDIALMTIKPVE